MQLLAQLVGILIIVACLVGIAFAVSPLAGWLISGVMALNVLFVLMRMHVTGWDE